MFFTKELNFNSKELIIRAYFYDGRNVEMVRIGRFSLASYKDIFYQTKKEWRGMEDVELHIKPYIADFNGDNLSEFIFCFSYGLTLYEPPVRFMNNKNFYINIEDNTIKEINDSKFNEYENIKSFGRYVDRASISMYEKELGDFNGDGKRDIVIIEKGNKKAIVY